MRLPIQVHVWVYKKINDEIKYLLLKRIPEKGGFWQASTGGLEEGETLEQCALRELKEETSIKEYLNFKGPIYVFQFEDEGYYKLTAKDKNVSMISISENKFIVSEYVYAVEVNNKIEIDLNNNIYPEHSEYKWCSYKEALDLLKYDTGKEALKILNDLLVNKNE